jgi:hypothetical protein
VAGSMKRKRVKDMLKDLRLVLCNGMYRLDADYKETARGVPFIRVAINGRTFDVIYRLTVKEFIIFDNKQNRTSLTQRNDVIDYFVNMINRRKLI